MVFVFFSNWAGGTCSLFLCGVQWFQRNSNPLDSFSIHNLSNTLSMFLHSCLHNVKRTAWFGHKNQKESIGKFEFSGDDRNIAERTSNAGGHETWIFHIFGPEKTAFVVLLPFHENMSRRNKQEHPPKHLFNLNRRSLQKVFLSLFLNWSFAHFDWLPFPITPNKEKLCAKKTTN